MPETIEPTGDDALYAHITSAAAPSATGSTTTPGTASAGTTATSTAPRALSSAAATATGGRSSSTWTAARSWRGTACWSTPRPTASARRRPSCSGASASAHYEIGFGATDANLIALEYFELGECIRSGATPEVTGEEGRADVALTYAPFEAGRLGRPVTLEDMLSGRADAYQREIDARYGLLEPEAAGMAR